MADKQPVTGLSVALSQVGMKRITLAKELDVDPHTVSRWTLGQCMPSTSNQLKISRLLGRTIDELFFAPNINHKVDDLKKVS